MATTTPNFGWTVPTSSDLVKNGATAIETLGDGIDASLVDLKGGTTGQVLSKASNTDMDFSWVTDATGIPATIFDAKGDIIAATAADTASRLAVGTNGQVLTADSTAATGLKWATPASSSPTFVGVNATRTNVSTTLTANGSYLVAFNTEEYDTNGFHDNSTNNSRITIPTGYGGKYQMSVWMNNPLGNPGSYQLFQMYKNGAQLTAGGIREGTYARQVGAANQPFSFSQTVSATAGDYFEVYYVQNNGETVNLWFNFQMSYLGA